MKVRDSQVLLLIQDTFYYGMAYSKKYGLYPHRYQVLLTRELFEKCQAVREGRSRKPSKELSKPFIFKGILVCKNCGCLMSPEIKKGKFIYYACTNAKGICKRVYVPENELLKPIRAVFEKFTKIPQKVQDKLVSELRALNEGEAEFHNREIDRIRTEYARLQTRSDGLVDLLLDKSITKADYDKKLQDIKDKQYRLNVELDEYTKADHQYHIHVGTVINLCRRIADIFESSEPMEKRALLNFLLQNPTVSGKKLEFTMRKPFDVVLELASHPTGLVCTNSLEPILRATHDLSRLAKPRRSSGSRTRRPLASAAFMLFYFSRGVCRNAFGAAGLGLGYTCKHPARSAKI